MAETVERRVVQLEIIAKGLEETNRRLAAVERSGASAAKTLGNFQSTLRTIGVGITFGAVLAHMKSVISAADELGKASQKIGIPTEELSKLAYAAELADVDLKTLSTGVKKLSIALVEAQNESSQQSKIFKALGVDIAAGPHKVLLQLADIFPRIADGETKTALATKLLGKSGVELIPLLNQGSAGIAKLTAEAERLGIVVSSETAKAAETFNDNLKAVKRSVDGLTISLVNQYAPGMERVTQAMKDAAEEGGILRALWVGMGGTLAELLGLMDDDKVKASKQLKKYKEEMLIYQNQINDAVKRGYDAEYALTKANQERYEWLKLQLRVQEQIVKAYAGTYDDQASRRARQGQGRPGIDSRLTGDVNTALGSDTLSFADKALADAKKNLAQANAELASSTATLTASEKKYLDLVNDPEWAKVGERKRADIKAAYDAAAVAERAAEANKFGLASELEAKKMLEAANAEMLNGVLHLTAAEKKYMDLQANPLWARLPDEIKERIKLILEEAAAKERSAKETNALLEAEQQMIEAWNKQRSAADDLINQTAQRSRDAKFELENLGKTAQQRELSNLARQREAALMKMVTPLQREVISNLYDEIEAMTKQLQAAEREIGFWEQLGEGVGNFLVDLAENGKDAFKTLEQAAKNFGKEMIAIFSKKLILQLGASLTTGATSAALANSAASAGGNSLAGAAVSGLSGWAGQSLGVGGAGLGTSVWGAMGAGTAVTETGTVFATGALAGQSVGSGMMGGIYSALANIPVWGWIAMAVIAIGAWIAGKHKGGPKVGGSFMGEFDPSGRLTSSTPVPGSDNGRFYTPNQGDSLTRQMVQGVATGYAEALRRYGGRSGGFRFGLGFDHDPAGTAQSRVSSMVTDRQGNVIYRAQDVNMDDKEVPAAMQLEARRMILAAIKASDLPDDLAAVFNQINVNGATNTAIDTVFMFADAIRDLNEVLGQDSVSLAYEQITMTQEGALRRQGASLTELRRNYDGSAESTRALMQATAEYRQAQMQLLATYEQAKLTIAGMFADTIRNIELSMLDNKGQYAYYQNEADDLLDQALGSTSIAEIERLSGKINQDIASAWALLSEEERRTMGPEFIERARAANEAIQERIRTLQQQIVQEGKDQITQIRTAILDAATKFDYASDKMNDAADKMQNQTVDVNIKVYDDRIATTADGGNVVNNGG